MRDLFRIVKRENRVVIATNFMGVKKSSLSRKRTSFVATTANHVPQPPNRSMEIGLFILLICRYGSFQKVRSGKCASARKQRPPPAPVAACADSGLRRPCARRKQDQPLLKPTKASRALDNRACRAVAALIRFRPATSGSGIPYYSPPVPMSQPIPAVLVVNAQSPPRRWV